MTWPEFKKFLQKNLDNSRAFVDSVWKKVKRDFEYQDKLVQDCAPHLEYLQSILIEFDSKWAPEEDMIIWYFRKGFCSSIRVEIEQRGQELDSFEKLVEKAVNANAKAALRPRSYACKTDQHCLRDSRPSAAKASTEGQPIKDPRVEELKKLEESKAPAAQRSNNIKTSEQAQKRKKKKDRRYYGQKLQDSTPATGVNLTNTLGGDSSGSERSQPQKNLSQITCYNCNKNGHYVTKCPEPPKAKN